MDISAYEQLFIDALNGHCPSAYQWMNTEIPFDEESCWTSRIIKRYTYTSLSREMINGIRPHGPFLELASGSGYLAAVLQAHGIPVHATDIDATGRNWAFEKLYTRIEGLSGPDAVRKYPTMNVLLSWPMWGDGIRGSPEYWQYEVLRNMQVGRILVYIGNWRGCTGSAVFHNCLRKRYRPVQIVRLPDVRGVHNAAHILRKVR